MTDLGRTNKLKHSIHTGNAAPTRQPVRRISPHRRDEIRTLLTEMLKKEVVEPSTSPWASPIVLVKKKDGSTHFCVDFRKLNDVTRRMPIPYPVSIPPSTRVQAPNGSARWTSSAATGRSRSRREIDQRPLSAQPRAFFNLRSCRSDFVTPRRLSSGSWTSFWLAFSGRTVSCTSTT